MFIFIFSYYLACFISSGIIFSLLEGSLIAYFCETFVSFIKFSCLLKTIFVDLTPDYSCYLLIGSPPVPGSSNLAVCLETLGAKTGNYYLMLDYLLSPRLSISLRASASSIFALFTY